MKKTFQDKRKDGSYHQTRKKREDGSKRITDNRKDKKRKSKPIKKRE